jgi:hypothetical protein
VTVLDICENPHSSSCTSKTASTLWFLSQQEKGSLISMRVISLIVERSEGMALPDRRDIGRYIKEKREVFEKYGDGE